MNSIEKTISRPMKWVFALFIFIFVMTVNYSEAEGVQILNKIAAPVVSSITEMNSEISMVSNSSSALNESYKSMDMGSEVNEEVPSIPEPATLIFMSLGLIALQANRLRKLHQE